MSKSCACSGIRICLFCKDLKKTETKDTSLRTTYCYCTHCEKAWPQRDCSEKYPTCNHTGKGIDFAGVRILPDFLTPEEERALVTAIDRVPWVESQSGRRKQDYGPKVNFKKRKVKTEVFTGLPAYSESLISRLRSSELLADFETVELCNLEYCPERGSGIDAHKDDEWLWGERLVTLNLLSDVRYTMTPTVDMARELATDTHILETDLHPASINPTADVAAHRVAKARPEELLSQLYGQARLENEVIEHCDINKAADLAEANVADVKPTDMVQDVPTDTVQCKPCHTAPETSPDKSKDPSIEVEILIPRRAVIVLYGPARTHWLHGVKASLIAQAGTRRLATTVRELTPLFLQGGAEEEVGSRVRSLAHNFNGISVGEWEARNKPREG